MPLVSVIVPNYNHAPYLEERINSILGQSFQDFEVILLDDCSTDGSRRILERFASHNERIRFVPNQTNSGSPFAQWNKGVELAQGAFIWIAESDDAAEPELLEENVRMLQENPTVGLAFCQSKLVNERGEFLRTYAEDYSFLFDSNRWEASFVGGGKEECARYLVQHNTIPNASAALMRKEVYQKVGGADPTWRLNGDWYFYAKLLLQSDVAYSPKVLNTFRVHANTQRQKANADHHAYDEILVVQDFICSQVAVPDEVRKRALSNVARWWSGSLFRQKINGRYFRENWRLYKVFRKRKPRLLGTISYIAGYLIMKQAISILGLKHWLKPILVKLFPKKFFKG